MPFPLAQRFHPAVASFAAAAMLCLFAYNPVRHPLRVVEITMRASSGTSAQVYFDTGRGFSERESVVLELTNDPIMHRVRLPRAELRLLRIDPMDDRGTFSIERLTYRTLSDSYEVDPKAVSGRAVKVHESELLPVAAGWEGTSFGKDPFLVFRRPEFAAQTPIAPVLAILGVLSCMTTVLVHLAFRFSIWPGRLRFLTTASGPQGIAKDAPHLLVLVFFAVLTYFTAWALIKPPLQSPDEFAHFSRTLGVPSAPWLPSKLTVTASARSVNPLLFQSRLHSVPNHPERKFSDVAIRNFKMLAWDRSKSSPPVKLATSAIHYPPVFYAVAYGLGESVTRVLNLSPYASLYSYRLVIAAVSSLLWTLVFCLLSGPLFLPARPAIFACMVLNPMLGFICSSINPDAFLLPLAALSILLASRAIISHESVLLTVGVIAATCLTKPAGLLLLPVIGLGGGFIALRRLVGRSPWARTLAYSAVCVFVPFLIAYGSYYRWLPAGPGPGLPPLSPEAYVAHLRSLEMYLFSGAWGILGWLDYSAGPRYYTAIRWALCLNALLFLLAFRKGGGRLEKSFLLLVGILHPIALFIMEFNLYPFVGYVMQGRYFLPGILGALVVLVHGHRWARGLLVLSVAVLSITLLTETVQRYYSGNWKMVYYAIPGVEIPGKPKTRPASAAAAGGESTPRAPAPGNRD